MINERNAPITNLIKVKETQTDVKIPMKQTSRPYFQLWKAILLVAEQRCVRYILLQYNKKAYNNLKLVCWRASFLEVHVPLYIQKWNRLSTQVVVSKINMIRLLRFLKWWSAFLKIIWDTHNCTEEDQNFVRCLLLAHSSSTKISNSQGALDASIYETKLTWSFIMIKQTLLDLSMPVFAARLIQFRNSLCI